MISILRVIIWILLITIIYRLIKTVYRVLKSSGSESHKKPESGKNSKYKINKEDVIEAKFEEIKPKENNNNS
ncbi:hypothetical protein ACSSWA_03595 [Melioribacter sp. Ez-97]|uniref:hypothetical protein n=1 Tax=Melioribacter sp. Ez-97 TaxID=3423434 RepID=UPI003EDA9BBF